MSNPSQAWALLSARAQQYHGMPPGFGGLTMDEVAAMMRGLERGPYLVALAHYAGDLRVLPDLERRLTVEITRIHVDAGWEAPTRGDHISRRLSATALYELFQPPLCEACGGRGERGRHRCVEARLRDTAQNTGNPRGSDGEWKRDDYGRMLPRKRPAYRTDIVHWSRYRKRLDTWAADHWQPITVRKVWRPARCTWCLGTGKSHMSGRLRADLAGITPSTWHRVWAPRYEVIYATLLGWRDIAWSHLARQLDANREAAA